MIVFLNRNPDFSCEHCGTLRRTVARTITFHYALLPVGEPLAHY